MELQACAHALRRFARDECSQEPLYVALCEFAAEDALIVTHESNFNYYEGVVFDLRPRVVHPDRLSLAPRQVHYILVKDKRTITDGERFMILQSKEFTQFDECGFLSFTSQDRINNLTGQFAIFKFESIGAMFIKTDGKGHRFSKQSESTRNKRCIYAMTTQSRNQSARAFGMCDAI